MAPEIIVNLAKDVHHYGQPIDVYSFAIIMYETLELRPAWVDMKYTHLIFQEVEEGGRPAIKASAPCSGYLDLMKNAWDNSPESRPIFETVLSKLRSIQDEIKTDSSVVSPIEGAIEIEMT